MKRLDTVPGGAGDIALYAAGPADAPVVLCVHGYPDTAAVWDELADALTAEPAPLRVVAFDVRGAGRSAAPDRSSGRAGWDLAALGEDVRRVAEAVAPGRPVHLVGHDWGAIQAWEAVAMDAGRPAPLFASLTTFGAPSLDHLGAWLAQRLRHREYAQILGQARRSWYVAVLRQPRLPELAWRHGLADRWGSVLVRTEGLRPRPGHPASTLADDGVRGAGLYRANVAKRLRRPRPQCTGIPVAVVVGRHDPYISVRVYDELSQWAPRSRMEVWDGGHWLQRSHAIELAAVIRRQVGSGEPGGSPEPS